MAQKTINQWFDEDQMTVNTLIIAISQVNADLVNQLIALTGASDTFTSHFSGQSQFQKVDFLFRTYLRGNNYQVSLLKRHLLICGMRHIVEQYARIFSPPPEPWRGPVVRAEDMTVPYSWMVYAELLIGGFLMVFGLFAYLQVFWTWEICLVSGTLLVVVVIYHVNLYRRFDTYLGHWAYILGHGDLLYAGSFKMRYHSFEELLANGTSYKLRLEDGEWKLILYGGWTGQVRPYPDGNRGNVIQIANNFKCQTNQNEDPDLIPIWASLIVAEQQNPGLIYDGHCINLKLSGQQARPNHGFFCCKPIPPARANAFFSAFRDEVRELYSYKFPDRPRIDF